MLKHSKIALISALILLMLLTVSGCGKKTGKLQEAFGLIEEMNYQGALDAFEQASAEKENKRLIARGKGIAYMGLAMYDEAVECFLTALGGSNGLVQDVDFDLNYYLASAYSHSGRFREAKDVYTAILDLRPKEKDAFFLRGNVELELDQYTEAKADFDQAVSMDPKNYDRLLAIYEVFAHFGYKAAGQEYLRTALDNGEKTLSAFDKGRIYYYLEEYPKAYVQLEEAKADETAESSLYLGKAYEATGDYNYACNVYRSYLEKKSDSAQMYNQLGICEMKRQNYEEALKAFQAGLSLQNKEMQQTLSYNEIVAYEYLSDFEKAASLMQVYVKNYPNDTQAQREDAFLSTRHTGSRSLDTEETKDAEVPSE